MVNGIQQGVCSGVCIGFLDEPGCGLILADEPIEDGDRLVFVHFRDVYPDGGWQGLRAGDRVEFSVSEERGKAFHRGLAATGASERKFVVKRGRDTDGRVRFVNVNQHSPGELDTDGSGIFVLTGDLERREYGQISEEWMDACKRLAENGSLLLYRCCWKQAANLAGWNVQGDLALLGCRFEDSFTLKDAYVHGDVHLEGADFSGKGGASFRGLRARNVYLDFGVKGPRDFVWLNEMRVDKKVVVGGEFQGGLQVMALQDAIVPARTVAEDGGDKACFEELIVGKEPYHAQRVNRTKVEGEIVIDGLRHGESVRLDRVECGEVSARGLGPGVTLEAIGCRISGNVTIEGKTDSTVKAISLRGAYIEGHLTLRELSLDGVLDLDETTVERVVRFSHLDFSANGGLQMASASLGRLVLDDVNMLYAGRGRTLWRNPRFMALKRERDKESYPSRELVQEYVMLKHLLGQEGQLRQEDEAFYNMRKCDYWHNRLAMLLFNYVFGWGVRLTNVVVSAFVLVALFVAVYKWLVPCRPLSDLLLLSLQAMFMAFFGEWKPEVEVGNSLTWIVTLESILGVVFVTVFVGAYVRKLLR